MQPAIFMGFQIWQYSTKLPEAMIREVVWLLRLFIDVRLCQLMLQNIH